MDADWFSIDNEDRLRAKIIEQENTIKILEQKLAEMERKVVISERERNMMIRTKKLFRFVPDGTSGSVYVARIPDIIIEKR